MRHDLLCLTVAALLCLMAWFFAGWTATAATLAVEAGRELNLGTRIWFMTGNFVSRYFVLIAAALLCAACAVAGWLRASAEDAAT